MAIKITDKGHIVEEVNTRSLNFEGSEDRREIVTHNPGFLVKWGATFIFIIFCLVVFYFTRIQYPDIIKTKAKLTSINAPKPVINIYPNKLIRLNVHEGQIIEKGEIIGVLESSADYREILRLSASLDSIKMGISSKKFTVIRKYLSNDYSKLGELQEQYLAFFKSALTLQYYIGSGIYPLKQVILKNDLEQLSKLRVQLEKQNKLQQEDFDLQQETFGMNLQLKKQNIISELNLRDEKSKLIHKELSVSNSEASIAQNGMLENETKKQLLELNNEIQEHIYSFSQYLYAFRNEVEEWKQKYFLVAPIKGKIVFATSIQEDQMLLANQTLCYVNPSNSNYFAEINIPQANFGKVQVGQDVILKLPSYPYQEFGFLKGRIEFISAIANDSGYRAKVKLMNGLTTVYHRNIQYRDGLVANGEIITDDLTLLEKLCNSIFRPMLK